MTKNERKKQLKKLSKSTIGEALREELNEIISKYGKRALEESKSFEEILGHRIAISILKEILDKLAIFKKQTKSKTLNEYI